MIDGTTVGSMKAEQFDHLYQTYQDDVLKVAFFYLRDRQKAEDITQDVFVKLYTTSPTLEKGKEKAWLLKVTLNKCRDLWRSAWVKKVVLGEKILAVKADDFSVAQTVEKQDLLLAIHELPHKAKEVIILHYYQHLKMEEIASLLNLPLGTVCSRLSRAKSKLAMILKGMA